MRFSTIILVATAGLAMANPLNIKPSGPGDDGCMVSDGANQSTITANRME